MKKRPVVVIVIACVLVAAGAIGIAYHATEFTLHPFRYDLLWVEAVRFLAIIFGVFLLRGQNWARWGAMAWMAFHIVLSAFHSTQEMLAHGLIFLLIAYGLFCPAAMRYFRTEHSTA